MLKNTFINLPRKVKETHGYTIYKRNWCIRKDWLKSETQIDASKLLRRFLSADWAKSKYKSDSSENVSEHGYADFSGTIAI